MGSTDRGAHRPLVSGIQILTARDNAAGTPTTFGLER